MTLTGRQKRALKSKGMTMEDDLRLGTAGISEGFVAHLDSLLSRKELVKLRFADLEGSARKTLAAEVGEASGAEVIGVVGRTMLLYRANPELPADQRALE
jgi:RNA-binding protein